MNKNTSSLKWVAVGVLMLAAFFGAYAFAQAKTGSTVNPGAFAAAGVASPVQVANAGAVGAPAGQSGATSGSGGAGCACCGSTQPTANGVTGPETPGTATVEAGVQKITVDLSKGYYAPNVIKVKAGTPVEITFGQSSGCTAVVQSQDLGFQSDLSAGPQTVALNAMKPGTYSFACGMNMVFGKIVAE